MLIAQVGIVGLAILMAAVLAAMVRAVRKGFPAIAIGIAALMAVQFFVASSGVLREWGRRPPPFFILMAVTTALTIGLAASGAGKAMAENLSIATLIGMQIFRLPLELILHRAAIDGIVPLQMSYSGNNFDIVTGITAVPVAWLPSRGHIPRWLVIAWNVLGSGLLAAIVAIAVASTPVFAAFGQQRLNTWIADAPYVWLPGVLVQTALLGHIVLWRKLSLR